MSRGSLDPVVPVAPERDVDDAVLRAAQLRRFREAYGRHRAAEGRGSAALTGLPYVRHGPHSRAWRVRARTFERFITEVVQVRAAEVSGRTLRVVDLGAGNGWLCHRLVQGGHVGIAIDLRDDSVDGLGAADAITAEAGPRFGRVVGSFEAVPLPDGCCDIAVFNAALHYALDLRATLAEAARIVVRGGRVVILDSPFYASETDGHAMVEDKRRTASERFGALAPELTALPFIEFLTRDRLMAASPDELPEWRRHRVRYPLAYELRPLLARLRGGRVPSRFDLWEARVS
jgi:SAM-dependent methyltransferase